MFIIEFVVKIIINESDISITKKREYMLLMLRSLLSMFNLFEDGVLYSEKASFVRLLGMIDQLLILLKSQFSNHMEEFLEIWSKQGLFEKINDVLQLSESVELKIEDQMTQLKKKESSSTFLQIIRKMIYNNEQTNGGKIDNFKMKTQVICESERGLRQMDEKRKSILPKENVAGSFMDIILCKEFIAQETFENECKVVLNLVLNNPNSHIITENFKKLFYNLLKMEEFTIKGVLSDFKMKNVIKETQKKHMEKMLGAKGRGSKSRITRFTDLSLIKLKDQSLFKMKSNFKSEEFIRKPSKSTTVGQPVNFSLVEEPTHNKPYEQMNNEITFPKWLLSCLEIILHSKTEPLIFNVLEFLYSMLDWENVSSFSLTVRYNNILYKEQRNYSNEGVFTVVLSKMFDLMEVNAYKKLALNYFLNFVLENCDFVIRFIKKKLKSGTPRDFRQIAGLWKHPSIMKSSMVRKLLEETVFDMLHYSDKEDPLIRNYFKNWLQFSENNFVLILNKLLKKLYLHTNMQLQGSLIVYNVMYNTSTFDHLLKLLQSVFSNGGTSFINFVRKIRISDEFEVYDSEMNTILSCYYKNKSKRYYSFIVKFLLCYLLAKPNKMLYSAKFEQSSEYTQY